MGTVNITKEGYPCQKWLSKTPNDHEDLDPVEFPDQYLVDAHNYCRNPNPDDKPEGPWCYFANKVGFGYCEIPFCPGMCNFIV